MTTTIIAIISIITAVLTCVTAFIVYRREKGEKPTEVTPPPSLKILKFKQQLPTPPVASDWKSKPKIGALVTLVFLAASLWSLYVRPSPIAVFSVGFCGLLLLAYIFILRRLTRGIHGPSYTRREVQFEIEDDYNAVFDRCENALRGMGAKIISSDRDLGLIHARTEKNWKSSGERVEITVLRRDHANCLVTLSSDALLPTILVGSGRNSRNLDTLIKYL